MKKERIAKNAIELHRKWESLELELPFEDWLEEEYLSPTGVEYETFARYDKEVHKGPTTVVERFALFTETFSKLLIQEPTTNPIPKELA